MTDRNEDRLLRKLFAALREEDRRTLPEFDLLVRQARLRARKPWRTRLGTRWAWAGMAAIVAFLVIFFLQSWRAPQPMSHSEALALARVIDAWRAPTDKVFEIPSLRIPQSVPTLEFTSLALPALPALESTRETRRFP